VVCGSSSPTSVVSSLHTTRRLVNVSECDVGVFGRRSKSFSGLALICGMQLVFLERKINTQLLKSFPSLAA
jgi:hypothetical protein